MAMDDIEILLFCDLFCCSSVACDLFKQCPAIDPAALSFLLPDSRLVAIFCHVGLDQCLYLADLDCPCGRYKLYKLCLSIDCIRHDKCYLDALLSKPACQAI